jgi:hypothetical protein
LDGRMLRAMFKDEEEYTEALRLYDLVQWIKRVGPYANRQGLRSMGGDTTTGEDLA